VEISFRAAITATGTGGTCRGWADVADDADSAESGVLLRRRLLLRRTRTDDEDVGELVAASEVRARTATLWPSVRRLRRRLLRRPRTMIRNRRQLAARTV